MESETYEDYVYGVFKKYVPRYKSTKTLHVYFMSGREEIYQSTSYSLYTLQNEGYYHRMEYCDVNRRIFKENEIAYAVRFVLHDSEDGTDIEVWKRNELIYEDKEQVINLNGKYYSIEELEQIVQILQQLLKNNLLRL